jgi:hypothetical protein
MKKSLGSFPRAQLKKMYGNKESEQRYLILSMEASTTEYMWL